MTTADIQPVACTRRFTSQQSCPRPISRGRLNARSVYQARNNSMVIAITPGEVRQRPMGSGMIHFAGDW